MSLDPTTFLTRAEGTHFDRKSLFEGPPHAKAARDRKTVRDQFAT
jgi:ATP-dependent DNA helicase RecG